MSQKSATLALALPRRPCRRERLVSSTASAILVTLATFLSTSELVTLIVSRVRLVHSNRGPGHKTALRAGNLL